MTINVTHLFAHICTDTHELVLKISSLDKFT